MDDTNSVQVLSCGCNYSFIDETLFYEPCSIECSYYKFIVSQREKAGKIAEIILDAS